MRQVKTIRSHAGVVLHKLDGGSVLESEEIYRERLIAAYPVRDNVGRLRARAHVCGLCLTVAVSPGLVDIGATTQPMRLKSS